MESRVKVRIQDQDFVLKCSLDPEYIKSLVSKLNSRIDSMQLPSGSPNESRQALILVALNLLDEIELMRQNQPETTNDEVVQKTNRLISMLEKGIVGDIV